MTYYRYIKFEPLYYLAMCLILTSKILFYSGNTQYCINAVQICHFSIKFRLDFGNETISYTASLKSE